MALTRRDLFAALIGSGAVGLGSVIGGSWIVSASPPEVLVNQIEAGRVMYAGSGRTDRFGFLIPLSAPARIPKVVIQYQGGKLTEIEGTGVGDSWLFHSQLDWVDGTVQPLVCTIRPLVAEELDQIEEVRIYVQDPGNPGSEPVEWIWRR